MLSKTRQKLAVVRAKTKPVVVAALLVRFFFFPDKSINKQLSLVFPDQLAEPGVKWAVGTS